MTTYCETQNKKPFDWETYINEAIKTKKQLDGLSQERLRLVNLSGRWETNPIGNLSEEITRDRLGAPLDPKLRELGEGFISAIIAHNWKSARNILDLINDRVKDL